MIVVVIICFQNHTTAHIQSLFNLMQQTMFFNESIYREGGFTYHFFITMILRTSRMYSQVQTNQIPYTIHTLPVNNFKTNFNKVTL